MRGSHGFTRHPMSDIHARFAGIDRLYGAGTLTRLAAARVTVVGIGGVGSWAVEALARSGVGHIRLVDADDLCLSNTNRQLPALDGQYGRLKVEAMAERLRAINPGISLEPVARFLTTDTMEPLLGEGGAPAGRQNRRGGGGQLDEITPRNHACLFRSRPPPGEQA